MDAYLGIDLTRYDKAAEEISLWKDEGVAYHEPVLFYETTDSDPALLACGGNIRKRAKLLHPIDRVIAVKDHALDICYTQGVDYEISDGELVFLEGGRMPLFQGALRSAKKAENAVNDPTVAANGSGSYAEWYITDRDPEGYGLMLHFDTLSQYAVYVTYEYSENWPGLALTPPEAQGSKLTKLYDKLAEDGRRINVLVLGDSTATGAAASGRDRAYDTFTRADTEGNISLLRKKDSHNGTGIKAPTFFERATRWLVDHSHVNHEIAYYNLAIGATHSAYGAEVLASRLAFMKQYYCDREVTPDIVYIKYMANEVRSTPERYVESMRRMTATLRAAYPDVTLVFVTGKINNTNCLIFKEHVENCLAMEAALSAFVKQTENAVLAPNTSVFHQIVKAKQPEDYLANNINHANDYWSYVTGQVILGAMRREG